jgi:hypothetical protein
MEFNKEFVYKNLYSKIVEETTFENAMQNFFNEIINDSREIDEIKKDFAEYEKQNLKIKEMLNSLFCNDIESKIFLNLIFKLEIYSLIELLIKEKTKNKTTFDNFKNNLMTAPLEEYAHIFEMFLLKEVINNLIHKNDTLIKI